MEGRTIKFDSTNSRPNAFAKTQAAIDSSWNVEFFRGKLVPIHYLSQISEGLREKLEDLDDGKPIAIDFEWQPDTRFEKHPISLIQLCSSKSCLVIRLQPREDSEILRQFLSTHQFFGKGCGNDRIKIKLTFGDDFQLNLEDVERTQLMNYQLTANFNNMITSFAGTPTAEFKSKRISRSNWAKQINVTQLLYAAFDVVGLYECYENFPGVREKRNLPPFEEGRQYFHI